MLQGALAPSVVGEVDTEMRDSGAARNVRYTFSATNTNTADEYEGEFEVTFSDGSIQTFPNRGYIPVVVQDDIG